MNITQGFDDDERAQVAAMYWSAFGQKLGRVLGPQHRAIAFIHDVLDPTHALTARGTDGSLLGVVGFKTYEGSLVDGTSADLAHHYGRIGSLWRVGLLSLLERDTENERFLMDGIFVSEGARDQGVGTALLNAICDHARAKGYAELRLDVIDTNPRAKALYLREGFVPTKVHRLGPLALVFQFKSAVTMVKQI